MCAVRGISFLLGHAFESHNVLNEFIKRKHKLLHLNCTDENQQDVLHLEVRESHYHNFHAKITLQMAVLPNRKDTFEGDLPLRKYRVPLELKKCIE